MKRSVLFFICTFVIVFSANFSQNEARAEVNEVQLEQYLTTIDWTTGDLVEYLGFFEVGLADFDSLEQLKLFLGTPINSDNLNDLLAKFNLSTNDLETLLAEYGETLADYKFIEDLELDIEFFLGHHDEFSIVTDFLSLFGLTEDEMENLFDHISYLDEETTENPLASIYESIDQISYLQGVDVLSQEEQAQLFSLWDDLLTTLNIDARYYLVKDDTMKPVELASIVNDDSLAGQSLFMALHNLEGDILATLVFSEDMIESHLMYESLEQLGEIVVLAQEYHQKLDTEKLPITAGNYAFKILISIFIIAVGFEFLLVARRRIHV